MEKVDYWFFVIMGCVLVAMQFGMIVAAIFGL